MNKVDFVNYYCYPLHCRFRIPCVVLVVVGVVLTAAVVLVAGVVLTAVAEQDG